MITLLFFKVGESIDYVVGQQQKTKMKSEDELQKPNGDGEKKHTKSKCIEYQVN